MQWIKKYYPAERITFYYALCTALYMLALPGIALENSLFSLLTARVIILSVIVMLRWIDAKRTTLMAFIRQIMPLALIIYWYPETYYIDSCFFPNLDGFFMHADNLLFGGQPSLLFCKIMPWIWFNELMNFAYLSFYFIIAITVVAGYNTAKEKGYKAAFVLLLAFIFFYLLFIILPVSGPQFYFSAPDNATPDTWPFRAVMTFLHGIGEKPTGAFPSSHVGITAICMCLLWNFHLRKLFWWLLPVALLLVASTVYIKAHYLIDVFAGLLVAPLFYVFSVRIWGKMSENKWLL